MDLSRHLKYTKTNFGALSKGPSIRSTKILNRVYHFLVLFGFVNNLLFFHPPERDDL